MRKNYLVMSFQPITIFLTIYITQRTLRIVSMLILCILLSVQSASKVYYAKPYCVPKIVASLVTKCVWRITEDRIV